MPPMKIPYIYLFLCVGFSFFLPNPDLLAMDQLKKLRNSIQCSNVLEKIDFSLKLNAQDYNKQLDTYFTILEEINLNDNKKQKNCRPEILNHHHSWIEKLDKDNPQYYSFLWHWMLQDKALALELAFNHENLLKDMEEAYYLFAEKNFPIRKYPFTDTFTSYIRTDSDFSTASSFFIGLVGANYFENFIFDLEKALGIKFGNIKETQTEGLNLKYFTFIQEYWEKNRIINSKLVIFLRWYYKKSLEYYQELILDNKTDSIGIMWAQAEIVCLFFFRHINGMLLIKNNNDAKSINFIFELISDYNASISESSKVIGFKGEQLKEFIHYLVKIIH